MRNIIITAIIATVFAASCSKNSSSIPVKTTSGTTGNNTTNTGSSGNKGTINSTVTGNWNVVSDYSYSFMIGDSATTYHNTAYTGVSGDYYKFTADSNIYIKEGNFLLDTGTFSVGSGNQLSMAYTYSYQDGLQFSGRAGYFHIFTCTTDSLIIKNGGITPGGSYIGETVVLSKASSF